MIANSSAVSLTGFGLFAVRGVEIAGYIKLKVKILAIRRWLNKKLNARIFTYRREVSEMPACGRCTGR